MALQLRRGTNAQRLQLTLKDGELVFVTDFQAAGVSPLWIGNGVAVGGVASTAVTALRDLTDVTLTNPVTNQLLNYNGTKWVNASNITIPGTLSVSGAATLSSTLAVAGATTIGGAGNLQNLTVWGTSYLGNVSASGAATLGSTLSVSGATAIGTTLGVTGNTSVGGTLTVSGATTLNGDLTINGTTTTVNATTLTVDDKNIELGSVATPTDTTANLGGITLRGATDKTIIWDSANNNWSSNQDWNVNSGKVYKMVNVPVLSGSGSGTLNVGPSATLVVLPATQTAALTATGNASISGTLGVTGNTSVGGTLGVTGATSVGGTLTVNGATTLKTTTIGANGIPQNLAVWGTSYFNQNVQVDAQVSASSFSTTGSAVIGGSLSAYGATINGSLYVDGTLSVNQNSNINIQGSIAATTGGFRTLTLGYSNTIASNTSVPGAIDFKGPYAAGTSNAVVARLETIDGTQISSNKPYALNGRNMLSEDVSSTETKTATQLINNVPTSVTESLRTLTVGESAHRVKIGGLQIEKASGPPVGAYVGAVGISGISSLTADSITATSLSATSINLNGSLSVSSITSSGNLSANTASITGTTTLAATTMSTTTHSGRIYNTSKESVVSGAISLTTNTTILSNDTNTNFSLADGQDGQMKTLISAVGSAVKTIAVAYAGWRTNATPFTGTLTLPARASCQLQFASGIGWICIGNNGATFS